MSSVWRTIFHPPLFVEETSAETWRSGSAFRLMILALAFFIDIAFIIAGHRNEFLHGDRIQAVYGIATVLVGIDIIITWGMFRGRWRSRSILTALVIAETAGQVLVIQATGTMHSPMIMMGVGCMVFYRVLFGWRLALISLLILTTGHFAAIGLEVAGVLAPAMVFNAPTPFQYDILAIRIWNTGILGAMYLFAFFGANAVVNVIRAKDRALAEARAEASRLAADVAQGRLTGALIKERYAMSELLGRGGMGEVYLARDVQNDCPVAIKVLHHALGRDIEMLQRFRREAELASVLPGDCTPAIVDVGIDYESDVHFIAMEYMPGEDLGAALRRRRRLPPSEVLALGRELARVLDVAHQNGIVHRDLKPQNTFLVAHDDGRLDVRLLDFGIAKLAEAGEQHGLTHNAIVLGSPGYMSPEQAAGNTRTAGPAADRFALAAILFRALTGATPFGDKTAMEYLHALAADEPKSATSLVPSLPSAVDAVFARGLAKAPRDRYATSESLITALSMALLGRERRVA